MVHLRDVCITTLWQILTGRADTRFETTADTGLKPLQIQVMNDTEQYGHQQNTGWIKTATQCLGLWAPEFERGISGSLVT